MSQIADDYRRRADAFERTIIEVEGPQWFQPSPCRRWNAKGIVIHVVHIHEHMIRSTWGEPQRTMQPTDDPLLAFQSVRAEIEAFLDDEDFATATLVTPTQLLTVEEHIKEVVSDDLPIHTWDLARAAGFECQLDPEDVAWLWSVVSAIPPSVMQMYRTPDALGKGIEVYGPEIEVPSDASMQDRLLGYIGRDPQWVPPTY
ncbi:MAG: TIGR03086 family protein [Actinomycetota bacterium]|nr:TIGR03086 family protein [Actinomycetota bacterium]